MNRVVALILFTLFIPLMVAIALVVLLSSGRPFLYRQQRLGINQTPFTFIKFRSMKKDAEALGAQFANVRDARVTRVGDFLRKSHLDELPQLWHIMRGQMNFIGPRPERPEFVKLYEGFEARWTIKPGITGMAQIRDTYHDIRRKGKYDLFYIMNRSWRLDALIVRQTILRMVGRANVAHI
jgi:lipopolysaccharide/colanic/teichoic acid biosynthesis glycosyltransferase